MNGRGFLSLAATTGLSTLWPNSLSANAPAIITSDKVRPAAPFGAQCGDVIANRPPLGRELELAELLRFIKRNKIKNVVWITADVHYCAAHYYDPARAQFTDFDPFWEFIAGPLNAGANKPGEMDDTFGRQVKFAGTPKDLKP